MTIGELKLFFKKELSTIYPNEEISSFLQLLLEDRLDLSRAQAALQAERNIDKTDEAYFLNVLEDLRNERPIQYILEKTHFYGLNFVVNDQVLIPRSETEELVDWILKELAAQNKTDKKISVLDIGTGSGCIAVSLAKGLPKAQVYALDVSASALELSEQNAVKNNVEIGTIQADILTIDTITDSAGTPLKFDVIVSNPPYVLEDEKQEIRPNVLHYEPHLALFVNDSNPLLFYDKIAALAKRHLNEQGRLFFEINQYMGSETLSLLKRKKFSRVILRKDLLENDRMIMAAN